jgi:hypothetical protein
LRVPDVGNHNHDIIMNSHAPIVSCRQKTAGPHHHLWNNHGTWWFHGTLHLPDYTAERRRFNLKTSDLHEAIRRRDAILAKCGFLTTRSSSAE